MTLRCLPPFLIALVGCATRQSPPDLAHIIVERVPSARVRIEGGWLIRDHDQLFVVGEVVKQLGDPDTTASQLDVRVFDDAGKVVRTATVDFAPRPIPSGHRMRGRSTFRYRLDPLPPETARIEIAARDDALSGPQKT